LSSNGRLVVDDLLRQALGPARECRRPASGDGPTITAGWHTLARVRDRQEVRQYVDGLRTNTTAVAAAGSWTIHKWGWQLTSSQALDEACVLGAFGAAWSNAMVARWSASPLGVLWPEMDAAFVTSVAVPRP
jgi:hypothetical protein